MYTTPLSTLISSLSLNHHLYADDTQLFFSFHPRNFDSSISHLQTALQLISSWMSTNLLTLNSSKTEFLIISVKQQLSKIDNSLLNTTHSARNLGLLPARRYSNVTAPKSFLVTPILRSLYCLKINKRIEYKLLSLTYKVLTTSQPDYLHNLISVQSSGRTRSSYVVTLARPSVSSSLQITNCSFYFRYA